MIALILLVLALVLFVVAAFGVGLGRVNFGWLACACFVLAYLLTGARGGW